MRFNTVTSVVTSIPSTSSHRHVRPGTVGSLCLLFCKVSRPFALRWGPNHGQTSPPQPVPPLTVWPGLLASHCEDEGACTTS